MKNLKLTILGFFIVYNCLGQSDNIDYEIKNISTNNKYSNFGAAFYGNDHLVFTSSSSGKMYDLYVGQIIGEDVQRQRVFSKGSDANTHQSNVAFTNDEKTVYFTKSIYGIKSRKKNNKPTIALYKATIIGDGKWTNIMPLPFNNNAYDVGHPTLNRENNKLYFSSNMPGTIGKSDIFVVDILPNNKYSKPRNLGPKINTKGNELHPFISGDNYLYFSSNGHKSNLGGLDIYAYHLENPSSKVKHLKRPINSSADDFSYIHRTNSKQGFFSSNRGGGKGFDDIYFFKEKKKEEITKVIETPKPIKKTKKSELALNQIGFNYNESKLYQRYTYQLDKAIIKMHEEVNLNIYIESHTDSRANDEFNMKLTEDRIFAITAYIAKKGISQKRIRGVAYGETKPLNHCVNNVKCTEEEYLKNRRTVFKLK